MSRKELTVLSCQLAAKEPRRCGMNENELTVRSWPLPVREATPESSQLRSDNWELRTGVQL